MQFRFAHDSTLAHLSFACLLYTSSVAGYYSAVGTINLGLAVNPVTGDLYVANTDALNLTNFEPNLRGHWVSNRITRIQVATGTVTPVSYTHLDVYKRQTYTHPNIALVSEERATLELGATQRIIENALGVSTVLFRPPYNADSQPQTRCV